MLEIGRAGLQDTTGQLWVESAIKAQPDLQSVECVNYNAFLEKDDVELSALLWRARQNGNTLDALERMYKVAPSEPAFSLVSLNTYLRTLANAVNGLHSLSVGEARSAVQRVQLSPHYDFATAEMAGQKLRLPTFTVYEKVGKMAVDLAASITVNGITEDTASKKQIVVRKRSRVVLYPSIESAEQQDFFVPYVFVDGRKAQRRLRREQRHFWDWVSQ